MEWGLFDLISIPTSWNAYPSLYNKNPAPSQERHNFPPLSRLAEGWRSLWSVCAPTTHSNPNLLSGSGSLGLPFPVSPGTSS